MSTEKIPAISKPNSSKLTVNMLEATLKGQRREELAKEAQRFRILVVGRANAGKTTILKKICNTTDQPVIYDGDGQKLDPSSVEPSTRRGNHDITNEMIFRSNPGFIFHDSCGFEAGGIGELQRVKAFVAERSKEKKLANQVHVIWYCIPLDDSRPITNAEVQFFSKSGTGKVPVIVVFTKCEALELQAIEALQEKQKLSYLNAVQEAPKYAMKHLWNAHLELEKCKYPPQSHIYLQEMNKPDTNCKELVECTASVLDSDVLQAIFVSTQQVSLEISLKYALRNLLYQKTQKANEILSKPEDKGTWILGILKMIMKYFPYWTVNLDQLPLDSLLDDLLHLDNYNAHLDDVVFCPQEIKSLNSALAQLADIYASFSIPSQIIQLGMAFIIIAEHVYFVWRHAGMFSPHTIPAISMLYQTSPQSTLVIEQASNAIAEYFTATEWSTWGYIIDIVQRRKIRNQAKDILQEKLYNIILENRLDKTGL